MCLPVFSLPGVRGGFVLLSSFFVLLFCCVWVCFRPLASLFFWFVFATIVFSGVGVVGVVGCVRGWVAAGLCVVWWVGCSEWLLWVFLFVWCECFFVGPGARGLARSRGMRSECVGA